MTKYGWAGTPSKYSTFKYGVTTTTNLLWSMEVDWDNDGVFDGQNEASYAYDFQSSRGRDYYIRPNGVGFEIMPIGEAVIRLYNDTGRYDPYNAAGPLYGNLLPGRKVQIKVKLGTAGDTEEVFTGRIALIKPYGRRGTVDLVIKDGWEFLANADSRAAIQTAITADDAIGTILDYVNWPTIWGRALDVGPDEIGYWWSKKRKAKPEIEDVVVSGMGYVFVARDGKLTYYSRHRDDSAVMTITEGELLKDITIPQPWEFRRNIINVQAHPRVLKNLQVIWTLQRDIPYLTAGESYTVWAQYRYNDIDVPAIDVVDPLASTDYFGNAQEDGGGADLTGNLTRTFTDFGETAKTTIKNGDASPPVYLTLLQIRGKPLETPNVAGMQATGAGYEDDPKTFDLDLPWSQSTSIAQDFANFLAGYLGAEPIFPQGFVEDRANIQFTLELFDRVNLDLTTWGIDNDYRVSKIKHKWIDKSGQYTRTEFKFEPTYDEGVGTYWRIGVDLLGVETIMGW